MQPSTIGRSSPKGTVPVPPPHPIDLIRASRSGITIQRSSEQLKFGDRRILHMSYGS